VISPRLVPERLLRVSFVQGTEAHEIGLLRRTRDFAGEKRRTAGLFEGGVKSASAGGGGVPGHHSHDMTSCILTLRLWGLAE
jgi:hypothetical protein